MRTLIIMLVLVSPCFGQVYINRPPFPHRGVYYMRDGYGRNYRIDQWNNIYRQQNRHGYIERSFKVERGKIYQYDSKGRLK